MPSKKLKMLGICLALLCVCWAAIFMVQVIRAKVLVSSGNWPQSFLTLRERNVIFKAVGDEPFAKAAPVLVRALVEFRPDFYWLNRSGDTPWDEKRYTNGQKNYVLAQTLWEAHLARPVDPAKADILVGLLRTAQRAEEKTMLIYALSNNNWTPAAVPLLAAIAADPHETLAARSCAINALLRHDDINRHMPRAIEIALASPIILERVLIFDGITTDVDPGNTPLNQESRDRLVSAGFEILMALQEKDWRGGGYFIAGKLGALLGGENNFHPNKKDPKYKQGKGGGLTEAYYTDSVRNALAWNQARMNSVVSPPSTR
ncbi:MAG: hypothetical protein WC661_15640 [Opitutaceae bacterium]|jgi:hypothetical protein